MVLAVGALPPFPAGWGAHASGALPPPPPPPGSYAYVHDILVYKLNSDL